MKRNIFMKCSSSYKSIFLASYGMLPKLYQYCIVEKTFNHKLSMAITSFAKNPLGDTWFFSLEAWYFYIQIFYFLIL